MGYLNNISIKNTKKKEEVEKPLQKKMIESSKI